MLPKMYFTIYDVRDIDIQKKADGKILHQPIHQQIYYYMYQSLLTVKRAK